MTSNNDVLAGLYALGNAYCAAVEEEGEPAGASMAAFLSVVLGWTWRQMDRFPNEEQIECIEECAEEMRDRIADLEEMANAEVRGAMH